MKVTCITCESENIDQGMDGSILCHDCGTIMLKMRKWQDSINIRDIES